ncbi:MAG TPA: ShlB/FhaC/HecB family hemolysin secretion/activation protein [Caulobacteraceae bacterium]|nr:ShlB/FhaC/HecB family hemolysin secretion/activation protein [Caulobacteraceae bacterium]
MKRLLAVALAATSLSAPGVGTAQTALSHINPERLDVNPPAARHRAQRLRHRRRTPAPAPEVKPFVLTRVEITGSTLPPGELAAAYQPFVGRTIDKAGLQAITDALAKVYEKSDVALYSVTVPDQDFSGGLLRLKAVEGFIARTDFKGGEHQPGLGLARRYARKLEAERPLKRQDLERYVSLMRDIPGWKPQIQLTQQDPDGAVDLEVDPDAQRVQGAASINNRGTAYLGRTQEQGDLYIDSLLRPGDQTRLSVALPTDVDRFQLYSFGETQPIGSDGLTVQGYGSYLRTRPEGLNVQGHAASLGGQVSYPLIRSTRQNLYLSASLDGLDSHNAFFGEELSNERTRTVRGAIAYSLTTSSSLLLLSGTASFGIDGLGAHEDPTLAKADFRKFNFKAAFNHTLGKQFVIRLDSAAQLTPDLLPASEQFSLGGEEFGRGYEASYLVGDEGYGASVELAYVIPKAPAAVSGAELYGFADKGEVRYYSRLGMPRQDLSLASAGGGVRVPIKKHLVVQLEAARGLEDPIPSLDGRVWRGIFSVRTAF